MKHIPLYILICMFIGCSNESQIENPIDKEYTICFNSGIIPSNIETRSPIETNYIPKDLKVGIYGVKTEVIDNEPEMPTWHATNIQENLNNEPYISQGLPSKELTSINGTIPIFPSDSKSTLVFYSYYPYTDGISYQEPNSPYISIEIKEDMKETIDYLYTGMVKALPKGSNTTVTLPFKHALSRLKIHVKTEDDKYYDDYCPLIKKIEIKTRQVQGGIMYINDGKTQAQGNGNKVFVYELEEPFMVLKENNNIENGTHTGAEFLFMQAENAIEEVKIGLTDENKKDTTITAYKYEPNISKPTDKISFVPGKIHNMYIEYNVRTNFRCEIVAWDYDNTNDYEKDVNQPEQQ